MKVRYLEEFRESRLDGRRILMYLYGYVPPYGIHMRLWMTRRGGTERYRGDPVINGVHAELPFIIIFIFINKKSNYLQEGNMFSSQ